MEMQAFWRVAFCLLVCTVVSRGSSVRIPENDLIFHLLDGYSPLARPAPDPEAATDVKVDLHMQSMLGIDEQNTLFVANMWIHLAWSDVRLSWNKSEHGNIDYVSINSNLIWTPDMILRNSFDDFYAIPEDKLFRAAVHADGSVNLWLAGKVRVLCDLDLTYFPIDKQACYLQFNSWTYGSNEVRLLNISDTITLINARNPQWEITRTSVRVSNESFSDGTSYESLFCFVYLARRPLFFTYSIVIPYTMLALVSMIMFCLPPDGGEKVSLGVTILLSFVVFQLLISEILPQSSEQVPLLFLYASGVELLTSFSIAFSVITINMHLTDSQMPASFRTFTFTILAKIVFLRQAKVNEKLQRSTSTQSTHSVPSISYGEVNHNNQHTNGGNIGVITFDPPAEPQINNKLWREASRIWDRFFLLLCTLFLIFFFVIMFFIYPTYQGDMEPVIIS